MGIITMDDDVDWHFHLRCSGVRTWKTAASAQRRVLFDCDYGSGGMCENYLPEYILAWGGYGNYVFGQEALLLLYIAVSE